MISPAAEACELYRATRLYGAKSERNRNSAMKKEDKGTKMWLNFRDLFGARSNVFNELRQLLPQILASANHCILLYTIK